ncbi:aromatic ring-hydroxylating oxygenase subunit alpha [Chromobacterium haemolyticum]|uniref:aromatic ring-hydroxylating oxygenase subunit alpha n=1 Tax=Chromobacterium haemolyticum TaxID=394935 RepID=UPI0009D919A8|nr:aromatic ring-hydroxylating dioxygenase subunit alpha [Chromobacterium haemolyticum]OQS37755.1 (Fe-S)-binding protein [Chromobacterium haemolyticum]
MSHSVIPFPAATTAPLRELLARRRPGYSLEAPFYRSPQVFEADLEYIFRRHWIYVGVSAEIPEPGDYLTVELGRDPILILRDDDMVIRAFHNVCRHRGSRLCAERQGSVGNLVCPYHQWTYDLSGRLIFADHMADGFDPSHHNLKPVALKNLEGLLFICLAERPPEDIDEMMARMAPYIAPHRIDDCKVAAQVDIVEAGNWKLTMENNRECYHCTANHPELTVSLYAYSYGFAPRAEQASGLADYQRVVAEHHARWEAGGLPSAEIERLSEVSGFRAMRMPLDRQGQSQTVDTGAACRKLLGDLRDPASGGLSFWTQPNSWHHFMADHIVTFTALPLSAESTLVRTTWLVRKDAVEGVDYEVDNLTRVWKATNQQDRRLVEESQRGINGAAYRPGPYSPYTEALVEKFTQWYAQRLGDGLERERHDHE